MLRIQYILSYSEFNDCELSLGDVDNSGDINVADIVIMIQEILFSAIEIQEINNQN